MLYKQWEDKFNHQKYQLRTLNSLFSCVSSQIMFFGEYLEESFLLRKYHWLTFQNNTISSYEPSFAFLCLNERERETEAVGKGVISHPQLQKKKRERERERQEKFTLEKWNKPTRLPLIRNSKCGNLTTYQRYAECFVFSFKSLHQVR